MSFLNLNIVNYSRSELSESPKRTLIDSPSPTREQKARQAVAEAAASVSAGGAPTKWRMQIGAATSGSSRFKKKPEHPEWDDDKRLGSKNGDAEEPKKQLGSQPPADKNMSVRKAMAMKEPQPKKEMEPPKKPKVLPPAPTTKPLITPGQVVLDKFGNFRLVTPPENKKTQDDDVPPLPPGAPPKGPYSGKFFYSRSLCCQQR